MEKYRTLSAAAAHKPTRENFEELLGLYPLLYGYWIKYAQSEFHSGGRVAAIKVFRRALEACRHTCDLWVAYIRFLVETNAKREEVVEIIKSAVGAVGSQFLSHNLWDIMIEFSRLHSLKYGLCPQNPELAPVEEVLFYILKTKTVHQFSRYYKELKKITRMEEKHLIELYTRQQTRVSKIWRYERHLKRPFFHPQPLSEQERKTWINYIDFITANEKENLYNRALEVDPGNEQLWMRYLRWSIAGQGEEKGNPQETRTKFERASRSLSRFATELRLYYALWLELHYPEDTKEYYEGLPRIGATYCQYAQFLERSGGDGARLLHEAASSLTDADVVEVLAELLKYDTEAFAKSHCKSPEFFRGWLKYQPERADEIWDKAPVGSVDDAYLLALRRTNIAKFVEMELALNR